MLVHEDGPFEMFWHIRDRIGVYERGEMRGLRDLFSCVWCMSVWMGAAVVLASRACPRVARPCVRALALSTASII